MLQSYANRSNSILAPSHLPMPLVLNKAGQVEVSLLKDQVSAMSRIDG